MPPETGDLHARIEQLHPLVEHICQRLDDEITKLGFPSKTIPCMKFPFLDFSLQVDPYSQQQALRAEWTDPPPGCSGLLMFHVDGTFYAECDVIRPHPKDQKWFVESVTAWGRDDLIKAEAKLLPAPGS